MRASATLLHISFWALVFIASGPPLYAVYDVAPSEGLPWKFAIFEILPVLLACVFYLFNWRSFASGWLVTTAAFSYIVLFSIMTSSRSTAALDFIWVPIWSICVVGPIGGALGVAMRRRNAEKK